MVETGLPALASAFAQKFGEVKFTSFGGDSADPSAMIGKGIAHVMELVKTVSNEVLSGDKGPSARRHPRMRRRARPRVRPPADARRGQNPW
jgi:hypothetical protein